MTIEKFNWTSHELNFATSFKTSKLNLNTRLIYIIEIVDNSGNKFYGEVAPLPDFGSETLFDVENCLENTDDQLIGLSLDSITTSLESILISFNQARTVRSAIEQILFQAINFHDPDSLWDIIPKPVKKEINVNGLIDIRSPHTSAETALILLENGYNTFKLKAGRDNFEDDLEAIKRIRKTLGKDVKIRIDVNGKWKFDDAIKNLRKLDKFNLQYVEQPVSNIEELIKLAEISPVPIAADESLRTSLDAEKLLESNIKYLVIKPALIGGVLSSLKIINLAKKVDKDVIISSSFESALARINLIYLCTQINNSNAHGITLSNIFNKDIFNDSLEIEDGKIDCTNFKFPHNADLSNLFEKC